MKKICTKCLKKKAMENQTTCTRCADKPMTPEETKQFTKLLNRLVDSLDMDNITLLKKAIALQKEWENTI